MDQTDRQILEILQEEGRIANNKLVKRIDLATTPTMDLVIEPGQALREIAE